MFSTQAIATRFITTKRFIQQYVIAAVLALTVTVAQSADDPTGWLMRINSAAEKISFSGNFVYLHDNQVEAMQVVRRIKDGHMQERLYALNGEAREVVRDQNRVWCYIPDKNVGVHDYRQTSQSGFPRILPGDIDALKQHYSFEGGSEDRIANRRAMQIKVKPKDNLRYGYSLWADKESGLLLRSDLVDSKGTIVEQYLFVNIDIDADISDEELASVTSKEQLVWYGTDVPNMTTDVAVKQWYVDTLPAGYKLTKHIRRMTPMDMEEEEHMVFTDGLSSVSVFVKKARAGQSGMIGPSRMGAINAYRDTVDNHWVTVMGEVPAETVRMLASKVSYRP